MSKHIWSILKQNETSADYYCENCGQAVWRSAGDSPESTSAYGPQIIDCDHFQYTIERAIQLSHKLQIKLMPYFYE